MSEIGCWLESLGLGHFASTFADAAIDLDILPEITEEDLEKLGIPLGHRKRLMKAIAELGETPSPVEPEPSAAGRETTPAPASALRPDAERRQLTVMFVDLVGSTALSQRLDPEDMRDSLRAYRNAVSGEVSRFDGHIAKFMGDGVLAYFGWPTAYEDQAERAVHAAIGIVDAVRGLESSDDDQLQIRVGIASGLVVVGDLLGEGISEEAAVTGATPNLASRLQEIATPGQIIIGDTTKRLIGNAFELIEMGDREVKGFADPVAAWKVLGETGAHGRFEAAHGESLLPLIGRTHEVGLLFDRWELAKAGAGQAVLVSGEAGIGKSRLVQALVERIAGEPHIRIRYQASPYHTTSALYPIARQVERAAGFDKADTAAKKRKKLEKLLQSSQVDIMAHTQVFASLFSIPLGSDDAAHKMTSDQLRERTIETLIEQLVGLSRQNPTLCVLEDAHWMDPSTEELIRRTMPRIHTEAVLMVITHRPEWQPDWVSGYDSVASLALSRLGPTQIAEMVRSVAGDAVDADTIERIAQRTDGVPLFIEELTRTMFEVGGNNLTTREDIPETLQGLLLAKLDQLDSNVRELVQIGAVIGREFSCGLLRKVLGQHRDLDPALKRLLASRLVFQSDTPRSPSYVFRHALIQEAAYSSLLVRRRRQYHRDIAAALEDESDTDTDVPLELIARHHTSAGDTGVAIPSWLRAGKRALERSANVEAVEHLQQGIDLAAKLPGGPDRLKLQLELYLVQGNAQKKAGRLLDAVRTYNRAARLARLADSAIDLTRAAIGFEEAQYLLGLPEDASILVLEEAIGKIRNDETIERCRMLSGLGRAYLTVGKFDQAREFSDEATRMARRIGDKSTLCDSLRIDYYSAAVGQTKKSQRTLEEIIRLAREIGDANLIMEAEGWRVLDYIQLGDREKYDAALTIYRQSAEKLQSPVQIWIASSYQVITEILDGDFAKAEGAAEEALRLGQEMLMESAPGVYGTQMFTIRREQGRLAEVAPIFKKFVDEHPHEPTWRPGLALVASDLGFIEPARKAFDELAEADFSVPYDAKRSTTLAYLAEVCSCLGDRARAETLYGLLLPYQDLTITMGVATVCYGAAARYLGLLANALEQWDIAAVHFESAIAKNTEMRAFPWLAHSHADYAAMLKKRGQRRDTKRIEELLHMAWSNATKYNMLMLQKRIQDRH